MLPVNASRFLPRIIYITYISGFEASGSFERR